MSVNPSSDSGTLVIRSGNADQTIDLGSKLGKILRPGDIVALIGDLSTGKTHFAKGVAFGLGVPDHEYVNSPAFDIVHEYQGRLTVYHMDFYRMETLTFEESLWMKEFLAESGVCLIEWADKFISSLCENYLKVELSFVNGDEEREIRISSVGYGYGDLIEGLKQKC